MVLNDIIKTAISLDDDISIRAGGMRRKNEIFNDTIRRIPEEYKDAVIRNWKVAPAAAGVNYSILAVEIDPKYANIVKEESCGKRRIKESEYNMSDKTDDYFYTEKAVTDFFNKKGWDTTNNEVKNYIGGVCDILEYDPDWIEGIYTLDDWYRDTKLNYPEDIEWLDSTRR